MANKVAKFRMGQKFQLKKNKIITISGVYREGNELMYFVDESKKAYPESELEKMEKVK